MCMRQISVRGLTAIVLVALLSSVQARMAMAGDASANSPAAMTDWGSERQDQGDFKPIRHVATEDYKRRKADILRGLDRPQLVASIDALFSYGITKVHPDTIAKSQGVEMGDQILGIGSVRTDPLFPYNFNSFRGPDSGEQPISIERFPGKLTSYGVKPGKWGVGLGEVTTRLTPIYLGDEATGKSWDDDLIVACLTMHSDLTLAETALAHAGDAGYRGPIGTAVASTIARHRCQHETAVFYGLKAIDGMRPEHAIGVAWQCAASGLACGRFATARSLIERFKMQMWFPRFDEFAETAQALRETYRQFPSPIAAAGQRDFVDLRPFAHPLEPYLVREVESIADGTSFSISSGFDRYQPRSWSPRAGNCSLSVRVTFDKPASGLEQDGLIVVGLSSWAGNEKSPMYLKVRILRSGILKLAFNDFNDLYLGRMPSISRLEPTSIQISAIDGVAEVTANGTRLYLGPSCFSSRSDTRMPLTYSWDMSVHAAKVTFQVLSWEALAPTAATTQSAVVTPQQRKGPLAQANELEKTGRRAEAGALLEHVSGVHDPVIHRAIGDLWMRSNAFDRAAEAYRHWAEGSRDPLAWLLWADARLKAAPDAAADVASTLGDRVSSTAAWAHSRLINPVSIALRHGGQQGACLRFLLPLQDSQNAGPLYQLFSTQVLIGDWRGARKTAAILLPQRALRLNYEIHLRLIDSVLALRLGEKPPAWTPVSDLFKKDDALPHLALSFAYLGGEMTEAEAESRAPTVPSGAIWQYYRGLKAFGMGDLTAAKRDFTAVQQQFPQDMEGITAKDFLLWFERSGDTASTVVSKDWPYVKPNYPPTDIPVDPPKPGANDF